VKNEAVLLPETLMKFFELGINETDFIYHCRDLKESLFIEYPLGSFLKILLTKISSAINESEAHKIIIDKIAPALFEDNAKLFSRIEMATIIKDFRDPKVVKPITEALTNIVKISPNLIFRDKIGNNLLHCLAIQAVFKHKTAGYNQSYYVSQKLFSEIPDESLAIMIHQTNLEDRIPISEGLAHLRAHTSTSAIKAFLNFVAMCTPHYTDYSIKQLENFEKDFNKIVSSTEGQPSDKKSFTTTFSAEMKGLKCKVMEIIEKREGMFHKLSAFHFYEIRQYLGV